MSVVNSDVNGDNKSEMSCSGNDVRDLCLAVYFNAVYFFFHYEHIQHLGISDT